MEELTLEFKLQNVTEEQEKAMAKLQADIEADADFVAANTLEEAYVAVKKYIKMTLEQFQEAYKNVREKVAGLFEEVQDKRELSDEELDIVAGGGFGSWFKKNWKKAASLTTVVVGAVAVVGCGIGLCVVLGTTAAITNLAGGALVGMASAVLGTYSYASEVQSEANPKFKSR